MLQQGAGYFGTKKNIPVKKKQGLVAAALHYFKNKYNKTVNYMRKYTASDLLPLGNRLEPHRYESCFKARVFFKDGGTKGFAPIFSYDTQLERDVMDEYAEAYLKNFQQFGFKAFFNQGGFWSMVGDFILQKIHIEQDNFLKAHIYANKIIVPCAVYGKKKPKEMPIQLATINRMNVSVWMQSFGIKPAAPTNPVTHPRNYHDVAV